MENQFSLLTKKRFLPFFITQFLGAFNDNVFKNALIVLIVFQLFQEQAALWTNVAAALFVIPFFLFSSIAGQVAEKYEKSKLMQHCKLAEIFIMVLGSVSLFLENPYLLVGTLFLMGTQSTFFGPVKYSILPQHLKEEELIGGNGLVEMGTFIAILLGTMVGAYYIVANNGTFIVSTIVLAIALLGYFSSFFIPKAESLLPDTKVSFNVFKESYNLFSILKNRRKSVFLSVFGVSWFWFLGATYLTQLPAFVKTYFYGDSSVVTMFLVTFSIGIAIGSILCEKLSRRRIELGIVPFGSIGLTIFGIMLYFYSGIEVQIKPDSILVLNYMEVISYFDAKMAIFSLFMIGVFGGFYTVPLYALIQKRTEPIYRSRVIAANNMLNAFFMVLSAVFAISLLSLGLEIHELFLAISILGAIVSIFIYNRVPEFFIRFVIWMLSHSIYRVKHENIDNLPEEGACVIVSNHISFFDALLLGGAFKRPVRFVMFETIYNVPVLKQFFRAVGAIPINTKKVNPECYENAFKEIKTLLENGEVLCIFPEGKLTADGEIDEFKSGIEKIINETPAPVLPVAIQGLWGSMFSRKNKIRFPRLKWSSLNIVVGELIKPENVKAKDLEDKVKILKGNKQ
jgi:1-acyl-sn-glycerol-3-phosphate acyltransferase